MSKSIATAGTQLSRAMMKGIKAGLTTEHCPTCMCEGGAKAMYDPSYPGSGCSGPVCYCPDGSRIYGPNCDCL